MPVSSYEHCVVNEFRVVGLVALDPRLWTLDSSGLIVKMTASLADHVAENGEVGFLFQSLLHAVDLQDSPEACQ